MFKVFPRGQLIYYNYLSIQWELDDAKDSRYYGHHGICPTVNQQEIIVEFFVYNFYVHRYHFPIQSDGENGQVSFWDKGVAIKSFKGV